MELEKEVLRILNSAELDVYWTMFKIFIGLVIIFVIKNQVSKISGYLIIRSNKHMSIGRKVSVDNFTGIIVDIALSGIFIRNECQLYIIPCDQATSKKWIFWVEQLKVDDGTICNKT